MTRVPLRVLNESPEAAQHEMGKAKETEATSEFILRRPTRKFLKTVESLQDRYRAAMLNDELMGNFEFPVLPGSHLHLTNPALEFIKFACAAFALAKEYQTEVGILKRNLLEVIGVREFADEAVFHNPCEPLKLSCVPCSHCDVIRDIDFCRDQDLLPNNIDVTHRWLCLSCGGEYDRLAIEFTLIGVVRGLERLFAQQDLKCSKCRQIQSDNVSRYCQCSGAYQFTMVKGDIRRKLRTIVNVAIVHNLGRLKVRPWYARHSANF
jgi:DNA polymerase epsilon subunit 1